MAVGWWEWPKDGGVARGPFSQSPLAPPLTLSPAFSPSLDPPRTATLENLTSLPALVGSRVTIRCAFGPAHPAPSYVQWLRNDRWEANTPGPALTFNADPARAGTYRCAGQNAAGRALSPPLSVIVWCEWWFRGPPPPSPIGGGSFGGPWERFHDPPSQFSLHPQNGGFEAPNNHFRWPPPPIKVSSPPR